MIKKIHTSVNGRVIDFDSMQESAPTTIAVGNARYNARGDKLGRDGVIEQTAESIAHEQLHSVNTSDVNNVSIKQNLDELKQARNNWINSEVLSTNPEDALNVEQAAELLNTPNLENINNQNVNTKKKATKAKRIIID